MPITQFRGELAPGFFMKGRGPGTRLEGVRVNEARGFWTEGQAHMRFYRDAAGQAREGCVWLETYSSGSRLASPCD